jgi:hypothetical protein
MELLLTGVFMMVSSVVIVLMGISYVGGFVAAWGTNLDSGRI